MGDDNLSAPLSTDEFSFKIKFENENHRIDSETYVRSLISMSTILKEFNYQSGSGEKISINIAAESAGSFEVSMVLAALKDMMSKNTIEYLGGLVVLLTGLIQFKNHFTKADQSKTELSGDNVLLRDNNGTVIHSVTNNSYQFFMNPVVHEAVSDQFRALSADKNISGIKFEFNEQSVSFPNSEFEHLAQPTEFAAPDSFESDAPATLTITRCVFEGENRKWEFILNGSRMSASITDREFWQGIDRGNRFGKGDKLIVDLRTLRVLDQTLGVYINKEYQVLKVRDHQPRLPVSQLELDTDEEDL